MNEERMAIGLIVSVLAWILVVIAAFFLAGAVVGIVAIGVGVNLLGWWLARVIRSDPSAPSSDPPAPGSAGR
jgi:hypothetical protein